MRRFSFKNARALPEGMADDPVGRRSSSNLGNNDGEPIFVVGGEQFELSTFAGTTTAAAAAASGERA